MILPLLIITQKNYAKQMDFSEDGSELNKQEQETGEQQEKQEEQEEDEEDEEGYGIFENKKVYLPPLDKFKPPLPPSRIFNLKGRRLQVFFIIRYFVSLLMVIIGYSKVGKHLSNS